MFSMSHITGTVYYTTDETRDYVHVGTVYDVVKWHLIPNRAHEWMLNTQRYGRKGTYYTQCKTWKMQW